MAECRVLCINRFVSIQSQNNMPVKLSSSAAIKAQVPEALQSGVPVIVSKQSGAAEILNHAIKIDFWDVDRLSSAITGVLRNRSLSSMLSAGGADEASKMGWEGPAGKVNSVYHQFIQA